MRDESEIDIDVEMIEVRRQCRNSLCHIAEHLQIFVRIEDDVMKERFLLEREKMLREGIEDRLLLSLNIVEDILNDVGRGREK